jgi:hypothetical protein
MTGRHGLGSGGRDLRPGGRSLGAREHAFVAPRHALVPALTPTRAGFRVRLEAIGPGRWASLFTGARETEDARGHEGRRAP